MKKILLIAGFFLLPSVALADVTNIMSLISMFQSVLNALVPLLFSVALIAFIVGVIRYIWAAGNAAKIKEARGFIFFCIVAMAVMLSVWSLAFLVHDSFFPTSPAGINFGSGGNASSGSTSGGTTSGNNGSNSSTSITNGGGQDLGECNTLQGPITKGSSCSGGMCDGSGNCISTSDSSYCNLMGTASDNLPCTQSNGTGGTCVDGACQPTEAAGECYNQREGASCANGTGFCSNGDCVVPSPSDAAYCSISGNDGSSCGYDGGDSNGTCQNGTCQPINDNQG